MLLKNDVMKLHPVQNDLDIVEAFRQYDVAKISDAMAKYGTLQAAIKPLRDTMRLCGHAVTVKTEPGDYGAPMRAVAAVQKGDVLLIDASGRETAAACGIELVQALIEARAEGLVVNGAVRDRLAILESGFPVFCRAVCSRKLNVREPAAINVPVNGGALVVYPGDLIVGDSDGVVSVPFYDLPRVLALSQAKLEHELSNQSKINAGAVMTVLYGVEPKIEKWREPVVNGGK